jgi:DNA repair protein RadA/Sms
MSIVTGDGWRQDPSVLVRIAHSGRSAHTEGWCHVANTRTIERTKDEATLVIREFKRERGKLIVDAEAWNRGELTHAAQFPLLDQRESAHFVAFAGRERSDVDWQKLLMGVTAQIRASLDAQQLDEEQAQPGKRAAIVTMSEVEAEPIEWLWEPYIAIGQICMADGDPGIGKTLTLTQLGATLSRGWPLPDQQGRLTLRTGAPHTTLMLSTEDGLADTLKPRLEQMGADCTRIHVLTGWFDDDDAHHVFSLQDMRVLESALQRYRPRLVVIDPIQAYLGKIDMHRSNETRPLMNALKAVAERCRCAIVCIRHPSKPGQGGGKAIHRGLGSVDLIGVARTGLFFEQHPTDITKALMCQSKSNIGRLGVTQVFSKDNGHFRWCGVSRISAELLGGSGRGPDPHALLGAMCWLEEHLQVETPTPSKQVEQEMEEAGYGHETVKRARRALGVISRRVGEAWYLTLPALPLTIPPLPSSPSSPTSPTTPPSMESSSYNSHYLGGQREEGQEGQVVSEGEVVQEAFMATLGTPQVQLTVDAIVGASSAIDLPLLTTNRRRICC